MIALIISVAFADAPQDLAKSCMDRYHNAAAIAACMAEPRFQALEAAQEDLSDQLGQIQEGQVEIREQVASLSDSVAKLTADRQEPTSISVPSTAPARTTFAVVGGVPYQSVQRPSLVSIYQTLTQIEGDTLHVTALGDRSSYERCGGTSKARVIVMNHGIPVPVWAPPGAPSGFVEVYADLDGDGEPDATPYKVLDPARQTGFYTTWRSGDALTFTYLRESGKVIQVPGLPLQTVWRTPRHGDNAPLHCRPGSASSPGGNLSANAYSLWRDWPAR